LQESKSANSTRRLRELPPPFSAQGQRLDTSDIAPQRASGELPNDAAAAAANPSITCIRASVASSASRRPRRSPGPLTDVKGRWAGPARAARAALRRRRRYRRWQGGTGPGARGRPLSTPPAPTARRSLAAPLPHALGGVGSGRGAMFSPIRRAAAAGPPAARNRRRGRAQAGRGPQGGAQGSGAPRTRWTGRPAAAESADRRHAPCHVA
jgi:hypothetical protein